MRPAFPGFPRHGPKTLTRFTLPTRNRGSVPRQPQVTKDEELLDFLVTIARNTQRVEHCHNSILPLHELDTGP